MDQKTMLSLEFGTKVYTGLQPYFCFLFGAGFRNTDGEHLYFY